MIKRFSSSYVKLKLKSCPREEKYKREEIFQPQNLETFCDQQILTLKTLCPLGYKLERHGYHQKPANLIISFIPLGTEFKFDIARYFPNLWHLFIITCNVIWNSRDCQLLTNSSTITCWSKCPDNNYFFYKFWISEFYHLIFLFYYTHLHYNEVSWAYITRSMCLFIMDEWNPWLSDWYTCTFPIFSPRSVKHVVLKACSKSTKQI